MAQSLSLDLVTMLRRNRTRLNADLFPSFAVDSLTSSDVFFYRSNINLERTRQNFTSRTGIYTLLQNLHEQETEPSLCYFFKYNYKSHQAEIIIIVKHLFHSTHCNTPKRGTSFGTHRVTAPGQHSFFRRNIAAVASRWQPCV